MYVYNILIFPTTDFKCIYQSISIKMSFIKINCNFESSDTYFDIFVDTVWFPYDKTQTSGRLSLSSQYLYLIGQLYSVLNLWFDMFDDVLKS